MRKFIVLLTVLYSILNAQAQTQDDVYATLGMPGDNLNLYLVLNIFKQSKSIENFERQLNDPKTRINNLDLNNDGTIDYLKVTDYGKDDYHTLIIQDIISASETQDVAVIDVQKSDGNTAHVQIVGDESLYGKNYIIEPLAENNSLQTQPNAIMNNHYYITDNTVPHVNVWSWPSISFIFENAYSPWISPWYWAYYPAWWTVRPHVIHKVYYAFHRDFGWHNYCRRNYFINQSHYYNYYSNRRLVAATVQINVTKNVYHNVPRGSNYNNSTNHYQSPKKNGGNWNGEENGTQHNNTNAGQNSKQNNPKWNKDDNNGNPNPNGNSNGSNNTKSNQPKGNNHWNAPASLSKPDMNNGPKNKSGWKGNANDGNKGKGSSIKTGTKGK